MTAPVGSVIDTMVLLKVLLMCACPWATFLRSLRRTFLTAAPARAFGGISLLRSYCAMGDGASPHGPCPQFRLKALLPTRLLLTCDRALRTLAGTSVGPRALTPDGEPTAVTDAGVAADLDLASDVRGDLAAQVALYLEIGLDVVAELDQLLVREVLDALVQIDRGGGQRLGCTRATDTEDVSERDLHPLLAGKIDAD